MPISDIHFDPFGPWTNEYAIDTSFESRQAPTRFVGSVTYRPGS